MSEQDKTAIEEYTQEQVKELVDKLAEAEKAKETLTNDIQTERAKKQEALQAKESVEQELSKIKEEKIDVTEPEPTDPEEVVRRVLKEKEEEESKSAFEQAKSEFKDLNKEFSDANDEAGIMYGKFEQELRKFNFDGLKTKEQYLKRLNEVKQFMDRSKKPDDGGEPIYDGTKPLGSEAPDASDTNLSAEEMKLIKDIGWDKERFLKQKARRPEYVAQLLNGSR